jgi:hypothetical protein
MPKQGDKRAMCGECRTNCFSDKEGKSIANDDGTTVPKHWRFGFFPTSTWLCEGSGTEKVTFSWEPTKFTLKGEGVACKWVKA